ncbi:MAG TPA: alpha/beta fold hydrolase [Methylovirgula sp.]|nr:alpha/beta fold hydrolase [Methylovirgula sp.]
MSALLVAILSASAATAAASVETFIAAPGPLAPLAGTMLTPAGKAPMVLIIPGSGPTDRDGNSPYGIKASTYKLLAEGLAAHGIGSVRIDKRGVGGSRAAVADGNAVTIADYVTDVKSWTSAIRKRTGASCVFLLGHSEGGLIALAAAQGATDVCGLVLISAAGRPLGEIMREQLRANPANAPILPEAMTAIDALEAGKRVDVSHMNPMLMPLFAPQVQGFLIDEFSYDPAKLIGKVTKPVLILQGERDLQISVADAQRLKQAAPEAELVLLANTNHVLKTVNSDDRQANIATYADPALPLAPGVVETIANFVVKP